MAHGDIPLAVRIELASRFFPNGAVEPYHCAFIERVWKPLPQWNHPINVAGTQGLTAAEIGA